MLLRSLLAACLLCAPGSASAPSAQSYSAVHQVFCSEGTGTAFEAGGHLITVAHVSTLHNCHTDDGRAVSGADEILDFADVGPSPYGFKINCDGFQAGEHYYAVGHAYGAPLQTIIHLTGTGQFAENGEAILWGYPTVIPGMSGGPILNLAGEVVGTVNQYSPIFPISMSQELKTTSLCAAKK